METATGIITDIDHLTKRIKVSVTDGDFYVEILWHKLNSYLVGESVKIKYIPDDQFAQLVENKQ